MSKYWLSNLQPHEVWRGLSSRATEMRTRTAELLCYIAEADARQLYRDQACDSMYACCVRVLGMSEDTASRWIEVGRSARRYPRLFSALEDGRLNVTTVLLLKPHITSSNADELITAAEGKTYREIRELVACRFPRPDLPTRLEELGPVPQSSHSIAAITPASDRGAVRTIGAGAVSGDSGTAGPTSMPPTANESQSLSAALRIDPTKLPEARESTVPLPPPAEPLPRIAPLSAERYGLQVTISKHAHDLLRRAQDLLAHTMPSGDVGTVLERALTELVEKLEHAKFAQTDRPARRRSSGDGRSIPAEIKRQVHARDGGRCTFESDDGRRCESRRRLEYDHIQPLAKGGLTTVDNVRQLCRPHNQLEAERRLGAGFMDEKRAERRVRTANRATHGERGGGRL